MRLKGKKSIVTGSGRGIGRSIALRFAREGADVCVADIDGKNAEEVATQIQSIGQDAIAVAVDVSISHQLDSMVQQAIKQFGHIDVLVNNAGIASLHPFLEVPEDILDRTFAVNLKGTFMCAQRVARHMVKRGTGGKIINMSSMSEEIGTPEFCHYSTTKGGIKIMTKCMALELAEHGINVNAIGPGEVDTDIVKDYFKDPGNLREAIEKIPLRRVAVPDDIAGTAVFLASSDSDYITGTTVFVDGGITAH